MVGGVEVAYCNKYILYPGEISVQAVRGKEQKPVKYIHRMDVRPDIAEKSRKNIDSVNAYIDKLRGTIVSIERIRSGQPRPYADSVDEAIIFCHRPNLFATNGPGICGITRKEAETLARIFVTNWSDEPKFLDSRLELLAPTPNPCGLDEYKSDFDKETRACAWRVIVRHPYND